MSMFNYQIAGSAFESCPIDLVYGLVYTNEDIVEIPKKIPFRRGWGMAETFNVIDRSPRSYPSALEICYLSIRERKAYESRVVFPDELFPMLWQPFYEYVIFGMAPNGKIAVWFGGEKKSALICAIKAHETDVDMADVAPFNPTMSLENYCSQFDLEYGDDTSFYLNLFESCVKQYNYRYCVLAEPTDSEKKGIDIGNDADKKHLVVDWIEDALCDGSYDKSHDGGLSTYHMGGRPHKMNIALHKGKVEWLVSLWFDDEVVKRFFERFYGAHPETKTDFIIRIDAENKKYELALYRQGLKEPVVMPEAAYQLIVFKNKFEDYRSENYNRPRGAWVW